MTILTFANVVARCGFNSNIFHAMEPTVILFAWLVLLGASCAVKKTLHPGVGAVVNMAPQSMRRIMGLIAVAACLAYSLLMRALRCAGQDARIGKMGHACARCFPSGNKQQAAL